MDGVEAVFFCVIIEQCLVTLSTTSYPQKNKACPRYQSLFYTEKFSQPEYSINMPPSTIDTLDFLKEYKREKRLGEGGEGEADLWVCTKSATTNIRKSPTFVVVKTIKKPKDKLPREALFLDQLKQYDHTNIIEMFGYVQTDIPLESLRVMLEYCNEGDLGKVVNDLHLKEQAITEFMLWDITMALLSALAFFKRRAY